MNWLLVLLKALGVADDLATKIVDGVSAALPEHFVPKDKYNSKAEEVKTLTATIAERDKQLSDIKKAAGEGEEKLKARIETLEAENKTATEAAKNAAKEAEEKFNKQALDMAISNEIGKAKGKNEKAIMALLDTSVIKLVDGKLIGLDEQMKTLKAKDGYLFEDGAADDTTPPGSNPASTYVGKDFGQMTTEERLAFKQKDPAKYDLQRQAFLLNSRK